MRLYVNQESSRYSLEGDVPYKTDSTFTDIHSSFRNCGAIWINVEIHTHNDAREAYHTRYDVVRNDMFRVS